MKTAFSVLSLVVCATNAWAATDVRVNFTLNTVDRKGVPVTQSRYYYVYRPDGLSKATPVPMILVMACVPNEGPAGFFHRKANQAGFVVVSCSFAGNSSGTPGAGWSNHNVYVDGFEDMDYTTEVINRVRLSDNGNDAFICGLSKGGHMAYACTRPDMLRAACSIDEFMELTVNVPVAPVPILAFQGTKDNNVPYTMQRDSVDVWRALDGLLGATPVTTYESSPRLVGNVTQATWRGGVNGMQVAFVTIIGGGHEYGVPSNSTGYDCTDGMWAFFSQFLTTTQATPKIVAQPVNNIQLSGQPASFWVTATGNPPLAYQWQKNGVDIPGATANWYTTAGTSMADNDAMFRAIVSNGSGSVISPAATLTVNPAPADPQITAQPADRSVTAGQPVTFAVAATSTATDTRSPRGSAGQSSLTYQWTKNGMNIVGATAASLTLPAALTADSGALFRVVVSGPSGSVTSTGATLTVKPAPGAPIIFTDPARVRVLINQTGTFSVTAWSQTPMSYQWQKGSFLGNMADIPGATAATYTTPLTTLADQHTLFRCIVSNAAGNTTSATEMLFATAAPTAPTQIAYPITAFGQTGVPFCYTIVSTGGTMPLTYSAGPLPPRLSLDRTTGVISGTPTAVGTTKCFITASNSAGSVSATLTLTMTLTPPVIPLDAWRAAHFGASQTNPDIAGDAADPDGDGANNLLEYNRGTDPLAADDTAR